MDYIGPIIAVILAVLIGGSFKLGHDAGWEAARQVCIKSIIEDSHDR